MEKKPIPKPKVELIFLWIESYRDHLENVGLNFSGDLEIGFDSKARKINIHKKTVSYPKDNSSSFWGKNVNSLTAIVGQNGAGKSNILDFIKGSSLSTRNNQASNFVAVYRITFSNQEARTSEIVVKSTFQEEALLGGYPEGLLIKGVKNSPYESVYMNQRVQINPITIFFSSFFDLRGKFIPDNSQYGAGIDISTNELAVTSIQVSNAQNGLRTLRYENTKMQLDLLGNEDLADFSTGSFGDFLPTEMGISLENTFDISSPNFPQRAVETFALRQLGDGLGPLYGKIIGAPQNNKPWGTGIWAEIIERQHTGLSDLMREYRRVGEQSIFDQEELKNIFKHLILYYGWKNIIVNEIHLAAESDNYHQITWLDRLIDKANDRVNWEDPLAIFSFLKGIVSYFRFPGAMSWADLVQTLFEGIKIGRIEYNGNFEMVLVLEGAKSINRAYNQYIRVRENEIERYEPDPDIGFLNFSFRDMSSGERALLDLFSKLHHALTKGLKEKSRIESLQNINPLILLIDEGEIGLHPKWQREYVQRLLNFLNGIKGEYWHSIQLIFTTHSPLVLSDIPKDHIIFLERQGKKCIVKNHHSDFCSFGANLHSILANSFFLEPDGFMGAYAKEKISQGLSWLSIKAEILLKTKRLENWGDSEILKERRDRETQYIGLLNKDLEKNEFFRLEESERKKTLTYLKEVIDEPLIKYEFSKLFEIVYKNG